MTNKMREQKSAAHQAQPSIQTTEHTTEISDDEEEANNPAAAHPRAVCSLMPPIL